MLVQVVHRSRPCAGETANGDGVFIGANTGLVTNGWEVLVAVIDALGHGPKAEHARVLAERALTDVPADATLKDVFDTVHLALRGSRGAAMAIVRHRADELEAAGVGNVAVRILQGAVLPFVPTPGVVGGQLRGLREARGSVHSGARILLHSDGISSRFDEALARTLQPEEACEQLLRRHGASHDDATIAIMDFAPAGPPSTGSEAPK